MLIPPFALVTPSVPGAVQAALVHICPPVQFSKPLMVRVPVPLRVPVRSIRLETVSGPVLMVSVPATLRFAIVGLEFSVADLPEGTHGLSVPTGMAPVLQLAGVSQALEVAPVNVRLQETAAGTLTPLKGTFCGLFAASSVITSVAVRVPRAEGVNAKIMVQLFEAEGGGGTATGAMHVPAPVGANSAAF